MFPGAHRGKQRLKTALQIPVHLEFIQSVTYDVVLALFYVVLNLIVLMA
jgi:hypothetical protein